MTKRAILISMAGVMNRNQREVAEFYAAFEKTLLKTLRAGDKVQLTGFGSFEVKKRAARKGINPRTGEPVRIAAKKAVCFRPAKAFNEGVQKK